VLDCLGGPGPGPLLPPGGPLPPGAPPDLVADAWTLRGSAHAALDDRASAAAAFKAALAADPAAVSALHALVDGHLLTPGEEADLITGLAYAPGDEWLQVSGMELERERDSVESSGNGNGESGRAFPLLNLIISLKITLISAPLRRLRL